MAYIRKCSDKYNRKEVVQFSIKGVKIKEWKTVGEIHRELGFDKSAILRCCKGKQKKSYHYVWKFKEDCNDSELSISKNESNGSNPSEDVSKSEEKDNATD